MQVILLSGGSGSRLWPLSNDARSKQFLRLLPGEQEGERESMVQRVVRQLRKSAVEAPVTVATATAQKDAVISQLGDCVSVVTEPERRDTFPAISLACEYLAHEKGCSPDETVLVIPCDAFAGDDYFDIVANMAKLASGRNVDLVLMGVKPTYPTSKYGYIIPAENKTDVSSFIEKPDTEYAAKLIEDGALWNGGVFAFKLGFMLDRARVYVNAPTFAEVRDSYGRYPGISFDYEVAERVARAAMVTYEGSWKDLGTWNTLTDELPFDTYGNVTVDGSGHNTHVINELEIPVMCIGTEDLVVAASPDGILVSEKSKSEAIKEYAPHLKERPMYEERRWGVYRVVDRTVSADGYGSLTKRLSLRPGGSISYQRHNHRSEVWTFIEGEGEVVIGSERKPVKRGDTVVIPAGTMHALRAVTPLTFIEVQAGGPLVEEDIERFDYTW